MRGVLSQAIDVLTKMRFPYPMPCTVRLLSCTGRLLLLAAAMRSTTSLDNGLALTPPMGWRSWNCYHGDVSAAKIQATIDAITARTRPVAGASGHKSLADLGYLHVGVE